MLRKDIIPRVTADRRGKITSGKKSDKGFPQSLDHFNVSKFPELIQVYGEKPDKLILFFPSNNIEDFFMTEYSKWGKKTGSPIKKRSCDGETCIHKIDESINGHTFAAGEESECVCKTLPEGHDDRCDTFTSLKAYVADKEGKVINPICYMFQSKSPNTSDALYSALASAWSLTGGKLIGIPFLTSVRKVSSSTEAKKKFPIWDMQPIGTVEQLMNMSQAAVIPTTEKNALPVNIEDERPMLTTGRAQKVLNSREESEIPTKSEHLSVSEKIEKMKSWLDKRDLSKEYIQIIDDVGATDILKRLRIKDLTHEKQLDINNKLVCRIKEIRKDLNE